MRVDYSKSKLAEKGRNGDEHLAHVAKGEMIVPPVISDEVRQMIYDEMIAQGLNPEEFIVNGDEMKINPETGQPEFFFKKLKRIASIALPVAASFIPGIGPIAAAGLGAAGGALGGGGLKGALLGAATSGIGSALSGGATGLLKGTALGGLENSITGALSPIGKSISSGVSGALSDFGNYTGIGDIYSSASGALSGIGDQIGDAYNGSVLQDTFKSGGDVLNAAGFNTGSESLTSGVGATGGGLPSSYSATADFNNYDLPSLNTSNSNIFANAGNPATAATASPLTGATEVAKSNYASPIASALLGRYTNNKAESQLLKQQAANRALFEPYTNFEFNPGDLTQDPGYQFNLAQGNQALDRAQLARGGYFSGEALKDAAKFTTGLADNTYNTAFNRALTTNQEGLRGAGAMAGVNENVGNIKAGSTVNTGNLFSGALGNILGGDSYTNTGALTGGKNGDYLSNLLRELELKRLMAA